MSVEDFKIDAAGSRITEQRVNTFNEWRRVFFTHYALDAGNQDHQNLWSEHLFRFSEVAIAIRRVMENAGQNYDPPLPDKDGNVQHALTELRVNFDRLKPYGLNGAAPDPDNMIKEARMHMAEITGESLTAIMAGANRRGAPFGSGEARAAFQAKTVKGGVPPRS